MYLKGEVLVLSKISSCFSDYSYINWCSVEKRFPGCGNVYSLINCQPPLLLVLQACAQPQGMHHGWPSTNMALLFPLPYAGFPSLPYDKSCDPSLTHEIQKVFWGLSGKDFPLLIKKKSHLRKEPLGQPLFLTFASLLCLWMKPWCVDLQEPSATMKLHAQGQTVNRA